MNRVLRLVSIFVFFISSSAFALEADLKAFFGNAEGVWKGFGQINELAQGGKNHSFNYLIDFGIRKARENLWHVGMKIVYESGAVVSPDGMYQVSGDHLIVIAGQTNEPVDVVSAGPNILEYKFQHSDAATGRIFNYDYHYVICPDGTFIGDAKTSINEVIISQDHFEAKKSAKGAAEPNDPNAYPFLAVQGGDHAAEIKATCAPQN